MDFQERMSYHDSVKKEFLRLLEMKPSWGKSEIKTLLMESETAANRSIIIEMQEQLIAANKINKTTETDQK